MEHHELGRADNLKSVSVKRKEEPSSSFSLCLTISQHFPLPLLCCHGLLDEGGASSRTFPQGMGNW